MSKLLIPYCNEGYYAGTKNLIEFLNPLECISCDSHFARCADVIFGDDTVCRDETSTSATSGTIGYKSCFETYNTKDTK